MSSEPERDDFGRELLDPIRYLPVFDERGRREGWAVPSEERETWDRLIEQRENGGGVYASRAPVPRPGSEVKELQRIVVELEAWLQLDGTLEAELRAAYEANPLKVTRIAADVLRGCEQRRLASPGGLLRSLLRRISAD